MVESINSIGSVFQKDTTSAADRSSTLFNSNSNMYLQLFLTQLKNQDPTQPFDTAQMTEQLSQLNTSQQLIDTNKNLENLVNLNKNSQASSLTGFINKEVEYLGDTFYQEGGSDVTIGYVNAAENQGLDIQIYDGAGKPVAQYSGEKGVGHHQFVWNGKDALGNDVNAGTYKIAVNAKNSSGDYTAVSTFLKGTVTGIDFATSSEPVVFIGNNSNRVGVDLSRISAVSSKTISTITN